VIRAREVSGTRYLFSWVMIVLFPLRLVAGDTTAALVHGKGGVWVNGAEATDSTSIFPGDLVETRPGFVANLDAEGSSVLIQSESIVKFQGNFLVLEHGSVSVGTSTSFSVHVNCIKVEPVNTGRTQYDVTDTTGTVQVDAKKSDVNITQTGGLQKTSKQSAVLASAIVREGEEAKRNESAACGAAERAPVAGHSNAKWIEIGGGAAGAVALCLVFCKSSPTTSVSPSDP
jgi:hypothetical protein